jgi:hypothetical protein
VQNPVADNPSKATDFCIIVPCTFENLAENRPTVYSGRPASFSDRADQVYGEEQQWLGFCEEQLRRWRRDHPTSPCRPNPYRHH